MPMNSAHASHLAPPASGLASWYTPGRSDGFGDRLLMFDNTDAISLELLRFRRELAHSSGFEDALHDRVDQLAHFRHPSFPLVRAVVHLEDEDLTLVAAHTAGQRLSELPTGKLRKGLHPAVVTWIIREVIPALAALQRSGTGVAHGALSADRIVLTSDGRLCIVEHVLGAAVRRLALTPAVFWHQFGLLAPVDERGLVRIDQRADVVQLGTIALSLLLARPVALGDFERRLPALLDEFSALAELSPSMFAAPLRTWLERALQLAPRSYRSAEDAQEGLHELPVPAAPMAALGGGAYQSSGTQTEADAAELSRDIASLARRQMQTPLRPRFPRELGPEAVGAAQALEAAPAPSASPTTDARRWKRAYSVWAAIALGVVAIVQSAIILRLGLQPSVVTITAPAMPPLPQPPISGTPNLTGSIATDVGSSQTVVTDTAATALADAAARQRSGGVRLSSRIALNVLEGDRVLGSTADGAIVTTAGTHQLDLVNTALGYRTRQTVTIRAGVITPLTLPTPMGRLNINAQPWAQVLIDDTPVGETPLANVAVPLGQHQITFRHPQLGERRETVTVRGDANARVSTTFDR
jgi:hypothetical protein